MRISSGISPAFCPTPLVAWSPLALTPFAWYRGDSVSLVGGVVDKLLDLSGNARDLTAPAGANRPTYTAADARMGRQPSIESTSVSHGLRSALAAAEWGFLSDNSGACVLMVIRRSSVYSSVGYVLSTQLASSVNVGIAYYDFGDATQRIQIGDGLTNGTASIPAGGAPTGRPLYCEGQYSAGVITLRAAATVIATGAGPLIPAPIPAATLNVLNYQNMNGGFRGALAEMVILPRVLTATERAAWVGYATGRYSG